jgi:hypothetical protein
LRAGQAQVSRVLLEALAQEPSCVVQQEAESAFGGIRHNMHNISVLMNPPTLGPPRIPQVGHVMQTYVSRRRVS